MAKDIATKTTGTLYAEVTDRIIAQLEAGRVPWVQPWDGADLESGLPRNAGTGRRYSGINVLILWATVFEHGFGTQGCGLPRSFPGQQGGGLSAGVPSGCNGR